MTYRVLAGYYSTLLVARLVALATGFTHCEACGPLSDESNQAGHMQYIDALDYSRRGLSSTGKIELARLARLVADLPAQEGVASWQVQGETGPRGEALLRLAIQAEPVLECQRCLGSLPWPIDTEVVLQLVRSESDLDDTEMSSDELESDYEKVVGSGRFDIHAQVEDELILSLPYIPRHPACSPDTPDDAAEAVPETRKPFAVLGELKGRLKKD